MIATKPISKSYELTRNSKTFLLVLLTRLVYCLRDVLLGLPFRSGLWDV